MTLGQDYFVTLERQLLSFTCESREGQINTHTHQFQELVCFLVCSQEKRLHLKAFVEFMMETDSSMHVNETSNSADSSISEFYSKLGKVIYHDGAGQVFPRNPTMAAQPLFVVHLQHIL